MLSLLQRKSITRELDNILNQVETFTINNINVPIKITYTDNYFIARYFKESIAAIFWHPTHEISLNITSSKEMYRIEKNQVNKKFRELIETTLNLEEIDYNICESIANAQYKHFINGQEVLSLLFKVDKDLSSEYDIFDKYKKFIQKNDKDRYDIVEYLESKKMILSKPSNIVDNKCYDEKNWLLHMIKNIVNQDNLNAEKEADNKRVEYCFKELKKTKDDIKRITLENKIEKETDLKRILELSKENANYKLKYMELEKQFKIIIDENYIYKNNDKKNKESTEKINDLEKELTEKNGSISSINESWNKYKEVLELHEKKESINNEHLKEKINIQNNTIKELENKNKEIQKKNNELNNNVENYKKKHEELNNNLENYKKINGELNNSLENYKKINGELNNSLENCKKKHEELNNNLENYKKKYEELNNNLENYKKKHEEFENINRRDGVIIGRVNKKLIEIKTKYNLLKTKNEEEQKKYIEENKNAKKEILELKKSTENITRKLNEKEKGYNSTLNALQKKLKSENSEDIKKELMQTKGEVSRLKEMNTELEIQMDKEIKEYIKEINNYKNKIIESEKINNNLSNEINEYEQKISAEKKNTAIIQNHWQKKIDKMIDNIKKKVSDTNTVNFILFQKYILGVKENIIRYNDNICAFNIALNRKMIQVEEFSKYCDKDIEEKQYKELKKVLEKMFLTITHTQKVCFNTEYTRIISNLDSMKLDLVPSKIHFTRI